MPSKSFLDNLEPIKAKKLKTVWEYVKDTLPITKIKTIKYLSNGQKEITLVNSSLEEFSGVGDSKEDALAECVSLKYPA